MTPSDFNWSFRGVIVRETGAFVPFNAALFKDIYIWWRYYWRERNRLPAIDLPPRKVACHPREVQNVYLLWGVMHQAGLEICPPGTDTPLHFYFSDQTYLDEDKNAPRGLNRDCRDISKSKVAQVFEDVFGYSLAVDPRVAPPPFICKSELNGKHDGYVATQNCEPQAGWVYQKLINTETAENTVLDLRCPTVFGGIPLVYLKERPLKQRFANMNSRCRLSTPEAHFSQEELALISQFCQKMKLDWGGLDILRDNADGKIYIVDVNKTDMGPPLALPLNDKLESTEILGRALRHAVDIHYPPALKDPKRD